MPIRSVSWALFCLLSGCSVRALKHPFDHRFYLAPAPRDTPSLSRLYNVLFNFETFKTAALIVCGVRERLVTGVFYPARPSAILVWPGLAYRRLFDGLLTTSAVHPSTPLTLRNPFLSSFCPEEPWFGRTAGLSGAIRHRNTTQKHGGTAQEGTQKGGNIWRDGTGGHKTPTVKHGGKFQG